MQVVHRKAAIVVAVFIVPSTCASIVSVIIVWVVLSIVEESKQQS